MYILKLHNKFIKTVYELLGENENDITYSIGWALANSSELLTALLSQFTSSKIIIKTDLLQIRLQQYEKDKGYTDFEIEQSDDFYFIIEAKKGWSLPKRKQIEQYLQRPSFKKSNASIKNIIVLSECSEPYYEANSGLRELNGIEIKPVSYKEVYTSALKALVKGSHAEKRILNDIIHYIGGIMTMQKQDSNKVYVVSLSSEKPVGWSISLIDIVEKRSLYFHPMGGRRGGWPVEPPNYIAFRYKGQLQSIHHIEKYEVFNNPNDVIKEIPSAYWGPHFLYYLGKGFKPNHDVKTGPKITRSLRVWCMLDTLFTCDTIQQARDISKTRDSIR